MVLQYTRVMRDFLSQQYELLVLPSASLRTSMMIRLGMRQDNRTVRREGILHAYFLAFLPSNYLVVSQKRGTSIYTPVYKKSLLLGPTKMVPLIWGKP